MFSSIKRLVSAFNEIEYGLLQAKLNDKKQMLKINHLRTLANSVKQSSGWKQLLRNLKEKINSPNFIIKLKALCTLHFFLQNNPIDELINFVIDEIHAQESNLTESVSSSEDDVAVYFEKNLIHPEKIYLKKLAIKIDTYKFAQKYNANTEQDPVLIVNQGFQALNLANTILGLQEVFLKLGRYYLDHIQAISLFLIYLEDLSVFNHFIKNVARLIVKDPDNSNPEQIRHNYLFITQAQKTSDRFSQFFYNRYYHPWTQKMFDIPKFMMVNGQAFQKVKKAAKKTDYGMVKLVKRSSNPQFNNSRSSMNDSNNVRSQILELSRSMSPQKKLHKTVSGMQTVMKKIESQITPNLQFLQLEQQQKYTENEEGYEQADQNRQRFLDIIFQQ